MDQPRQALLQIIAPHFVAGMVMEEDGVFWRAVRLAPIIRYMVGWQWPRITGYCKKKGWQVRYINGDTR